MTSRLVWRQLVAEQIRLLDRRTLRLRWCSVAAERPGHQKAGFVRRFLTSINVAGTIIVAIMAATLVAPGMAHAAVDPTPEIVDFAALEVPAAGTYYLQSVRTNRYLDADANGSVGTSRRPKADDRWDLIETDQGGVVFNFENTQHATFTSENRWTVEPIADGSVYLRRMGAIPGPPRYLSTDGNNVEMDFRNAADRWVLIPRAEFDPSVYVGERVALRSLLSARVLDIDAGTGAVGQSSTRRADDVWVAEDAGLGDVYLVNESTGRYLSARDGRVVESSASAGPDSRWRLRDEPVNGVAGYVSVAHIETGGYLAGFAIGRGWEVGWVPRVWTASTWRIELLGDTP